MRALKHILVSSADCNQAYTPHDPSTDPIVESELKEFTYLLPAEASLPYMKNKQSLMWSEFHKMQANPSYSPAHLQTRDPNRQQVDLRRSSRMP